MFCHWLEGLCLVPPGVYTVAFHCKLYDVVNDCQEKEQAGNADPAEATICR